MQLLFSLMMILHYQDWQSTFDNITVKKCGFLASSFKYDYIAVTLLLNRVCLCVIIRATKW